MKGEFDAEELAALRTVGWTPGATSASCPDPSLLMAADAGVLDDEASQQVLAHVATCQTCKLLATDLSEVLDEAPSEGERERISARVAFRPSARSARSTLYWGLGASGLLSAAAIAGVLVVNQRDVAPLDVQNQRDAGRIVVATPTVFKADRPNIMRPEPELTLRGESAPLPMLEQIGTALDTADAGDLAGAITGLTAVVRRESSSAEAHLALGATLLRADRVGESLPLLERAKLLAGPAATDEFDWYLAIALARSRAFVRAAAVMEPLCRRPTLRGAMACAGLAEINRTPSR